MLTPTCKVSQSGTTRYPGRNPFVGGVPALSGAGGFLLKDIVLLVAPFWTLGDSLTTPNYE